MKYTTDNTINKLEDIKNRIIKIVEQFFNSLKIDIENKQQKNKENQKRDAELLKSLVNIILNLGLRKMVISHYFIRNIKLRKKYDICHSLLW